MKNSQLQYAVARNFIKLLYYILLLMSHSIKQYYFSKFGYDLIISYFIASFIGLNHSISWFFIINMDLKLAIDSSILKNLLGISS